MFSFARDHSIRVIESPFVAVFSQIGIPYAADIMNFVILTALLSVAKASRAFSGMPFGVTFLNRALIMFSFARDHSIRVDLEGSRCD
jgi:L-asparagine transporter-like permease